MRNRIVISAVVGLSLALALDGRAASQVPEGWNPCPRCQNNADRTQARERNHIDEITALGIRPHVTDTITSTDGDKVRLAGEVVRLIEAWRGAGG